MNAKQLSRCMSSNYRHSNIVADVRHPAGHWVAVKMGGRKVSHRRVKAAMQAAKREYPHCEVFFRHGGVLVTSDLAADWQHHTAYNGYWWPKLAKWVAKAAKTASRINEMGE